MEHCAFCDIRDKKGPAKILYEDTDVFVIPDLHPKSPVHILIIPKMHVKELIAVEEPALLQKLLVVAQHMIRELKIENKSYRIKINGGGMQIIDHLHVHLTAASA